MLVALATARPFALFEAYNICGRGGWEGDLMAVGARLEGSRRDHLAVIPGRCEASNPESRDSQVRNSAP
jgi:hypothetical protein